LYHSLLANLYEGNNADKSLQHLQTALSLAKTATDKNIIVRRIGTLKKQN